MRSLKVVFRSSGERCHRKREVSNTMVIKKLFVRFPLHLEEWFNLWLQVIRAFKRLTTTKPKNFRRRHLRTSLAFNTTQLIFNLSKDTLCWRNFETKQIFLTYSAIRVIKSRSVVFFTSFVTSYSTLLSDHIWPSTLHQSSQFLYWDINPLQCLLHFFIQTWTCSDPSHWH